MAEEECQHKWRETDLYCEDCGDHSGVICDECYETYDAVWNWDEYIKIVDELIANGQG